MHTIFIELLLLSLFLRLHLPFDVDVHQFLLARVQFADELRVENFVISARQSVEERIDFDKEEDATLSDVSVRMVDNLSVEITLLDNSFKQLFIGLSLSDFQVQLLWLSLNPNCDSLEQGLESGRLFDMQKRHNRFREEFDLIFHDQCFECIIRILIHKALLLL